ncbi:MAG: DNA-binding response regulator, OmpR family, contains and winged-helix (wHTH) domain [Chitinophagaceae bacterium]|nr:DNA-binding response regulator, OmpR family, contains and winged-helix (wHTH) domain [Chitinophagaceae bacterium]
MKILIVEDEEELLKSIINYFQEEKFQCDFALNIKEARLKMSLEKFDCFILDIGLPDGSGLDLIKEIKEQKQEPNIIILSARNAAEQKVEGLNLGADDYLAKPFDLSELNARVNSILRRHKKLAQKEIVFKEIKIKTDTFQVFINEGEIRLKKKEYDLLLYFITNQNKVISKQAIVEHLWGTFQDNHESYDFLYTQIKNLRKKIIAGGGNDYLQNINRIGYRFKE